MNTDKQGWLPIISAGLLLTFWIFFAVFLPMTEPYINWVMDDDWIWINTLGFIGSALGILALYAIYFKIELRGFLDRIALGLAIFGITILTSILFFESFILKGIALENKNIIDLNGSFYVFQPFKLASLIGGLLFSFGMTLLGVLMIKKRTFKRWSLLLLTIGSPLFGIVLVPGNLRLLGVLLYSIAFIAIGFQMLKRKNDNNT